MVEFIVRGIIIEKESQMPMTLLQEREGGMILPLWVGPREASSIILEMKGVQAPQLLSHDIFASFLQRHRYKVRNLEIYEKVGDEYLARFFYSKGFRQYTIDIRPGYGIALALKLKSPILGTPGLLEQSAPMENDSEFEELLSSEMFFLKTEYGENPWL